MREAQSAAARLVLSQFDRAHGDLAGALILGRVKIDFLAFVQGRDARALKGSHVHENVIAAVGRRNEAEAFLAVEEFNSTVRHRNKSHISL